MYKVRQTKNVLSKMKMVKIAFEHIEWQSKLNLNENKTNLNAFYYSLLDP